MSMIDEPEWAKAQREEARRVGNRFKGLWAALLVASLVMIVTSQFEYELAMKIGAVSYLLISAASFYWSRRTPRGSFTHSFGFSLGVLGAIFAVILMIPTGVTEWG